jgi:hypothetical protein
MLDNAIFDQFKQSVGVRQLWWPIDIAEREVETRRIKLNRAIAHDVREDHIWLPRV